MRHIKYLTAFSVMGIVMASALPANAISNFTSNDIIEVTAPSGTNNADGAGTISGGSGNSNDPLLTDDAFLEKLTFENKTINFGSGNNFRAVQRVTVLQGREGNLNNGDATDDANVNAEFGADDTNSDGDDTPFHKAGLVATGNSVPESTRESTNPDDQDAALLQAFNNTNLVEIADGEGFQSYKLQLIFDQGIKDQPNAPEIVLFERGINDDDITVELITGGQFDNPTIFSGSSTKRSDSYDDTGLNLSTDEIAPKDQDLGVIGLDLDTDFGVTNETVFGVQITSNSGGADINSALLASQDPNQFEDVPSALSGVPVPFETEGSMGLVALGGYVFYRYRKNRKQAFSKHD